MTVLARSVTTLRRAAGLHRDAERQSAASIVRFWWLTTMQLGLLAELGDEAEEAVQVDVVERGLDLVHHVERRRPAAEHGEQERQRGERALATGQQRQLLDVLARRLGLDLDAGVEQVVGVGEHEPARAAGEQRREQLRRSSAPTSAKAAANTFSISSSTALMTCASSRRVSLHVLELLLEERVALLQLVELLERERVDRAHQAQLALELADPRRRRSTPSGSCGALGGLGRPRARRRGRGAASRPRSRAAAGPRPRRARPAARARAISSSARSASCARACAAASRPASTARTSSLWRRRCSCSSSCSASITPRCAVDERREPVDARSSERSTSCRRSAARARASASASSRRSISASRCSRNCRRSCRPAVRTSRSAAPRREHGGPRVELGPGLASDRAGVGLGLLVGLERGQQRLELGDPLPARRSSAAGSSVGGAVERSRARPAARGAGLEHSGERLGGGGEAGVVLVEPAIAARARRRARVPRAERAVRRAARSARVPAPRRGRRPGALGLVERGGGGAGTGGADAPAGRRRSGRRQR